MSGEMIFIIYSFVLGFAVPLVLILVFYVLVIRRLRTVGPKRKPRNAEDKSDGQPATQQSSRAKERKKSHRKVTKLVLTVITVYFLCWAPYWASQVNLFDEIIVYKLIVRVMQIFLNFCVFLRL